MKAGVALRGFVAKGSGMAVALLLFASCATGPAEQQIVSLQDSYTRLVDGIAEAALNDPGGVAFLSFGPTGTAAQTEDDGTDAPEDRFGLYFADGLATRLVSRHSGMQVVERSILEDVLAERGYNYVGLLNQEKIENLQDFTPARYIVTGTYTVLSSVLEVTVRLVDTRDATIAMSGLARIFLADDVRELLGLPSETASREAVVVEDVEGAMPEADFQPIFASLADEAFDDDRAALLRVAFQGAALTANQVYRLVSEFSFDDGRIAAIRVLHPLTIDKENAYRLLDLLSFQQSRDEVSEYLVSYAQGE